MAFATIGFRRYIGKAGKAVWRLLLILQQISGVTFSLLVTSLVVVMVICRYLLHVPLMWVEELDTYVAFWFYLLGASLATYKHLNIEGGIIHVVFRNRPRVQLGFKVGTNAIAVGLSSLLAAWSWSTFYWSIFGPGPPLTGTLFLPLGWSQLSLVVGFSLSALYFLVHLIQGIKALTSGSSLVKEGSATC